MLDQATAIKRIQASRDAFWFSLGAYALLTQEPSKGQLARYQIRIGESDAIEVAHGDFANSAGMSYQVGFNVGVDDASARSVVERTFRQMLVEAFEIAKEYSKSNSLQAKTEPWYDFARHYRNGVAHNGKWDIRSDVGLPLVWRNRTVTRALDGTSIDGFLSWFEGMQLGAQMTLFVQSSQP